MLIVEKKYFVTLHKKTKRKNKSILAWRNDTKRTVFCTCLTEGREENEEEGERDRKSWRSNPDQLFSVSESLFSLSLSLSLSLCVFLGYRVSAEAPLEILIAAHGVGLSFLWFLTFRRSISLMQSCRALASIKSNIYQKIKRERERGRIKRVMA